MVSPIFAPLLTILTIQSIGYEFDLQVRRKRKSLDLTSHHFHAAAAGPASQVIPANLLREASFRSLFNPFSCESQRLCCSCLCLCSQAAKSPRVSLSWPISSASWVVGCVPKFSRTLQQTRGLAFLNHLS